MNRIILITLSLFITSCVTVAPVVNPNDRIGIYGVSSLPPQNGDWSIITVTGYQMALARNGNSKNESLAVNISIFKLPELASNKAFLDYFVQSRASAPDIGRFEILTNTEELSSLNSASCVKYHSISKDKNAQIQNKQTAVMLLENRGYNCKHPKNSAIGVNIEYSLRHYPKTDYSSLEKNANEFFSNIKFTKF